MSKRQKTLAHKRLLELLRYDPETGLFYWKVNKGAIKIGQRAGCIQEKRGYKRWQIVVDAVHHKAHRLAWFYVYGTWPDHVDHINGDALDNRIKNLRIATEAQNMANSVHPKGHSGIRGVCFFRNGWMAQISHKGRSLYLGRYQTAEEAKEAWDAAAKRLRGNFARLD